jgi:hypothetical protein
MWPCSHPTKEKPRSRILLSLSLSWLCAYRVDRRTERAPSKLSILWFCSLLYLWNHRRLTLSYGSVVFHTYETTGAWPLLVILQCSIPVKPTGSRPRLLYPDSVALSGCSIPHKAIRRKSWGCCDSVVLSSHRVDRKTDCISLARTLLC